MTNNAPKNERRETPASHEAVRAVLMQLAVQRGPSKTFCPSEAARALSHAWRDMMPLVRDVAATMPEVRATQKGIEVDPLTARGPIRLGLRPSSTETTDQTT